jgi:hypothetical protein
MKIRTWFVLIPDMALLRTMFCALVFCSGCLHHRISIGDEYRIDDTGEIPMLVPIAAQSAESGEFQTVTVTFSAGSPDAKNRLSNDCGVEGITFSLHSGSNSDKRSWVVRSPSKAGWDTISSRMDIEAEWKLFVRELARVYDRGCFPTGLALQSIRSEITERIPLPANLVPIFMFSDQGEHFVDLTPGMEVGIQKVLSTGALVNSGSGNSLRMLTVAYDVISFDGGRVRLRLSRSSDSASNTQLATEDQLILTTLDRRFARAAVLRLYLQGFSPSESESHAILIGASGPTQLDTMTDLIRKRDPVACVRFQGTTCVDLPSGSVSLLSSIWINGRRTTCPFGASLASRLFLLPEVNQAEALESVQVSRRLGVGHYASIHLTRTIEGAQHLLLLPGDRIEWRN